MTQKPKRQTNIDGERLRKILAANPVDEDFSADIADLRNVETQAGIPKSIVERRAPRHLGGNR